MFCLPKTAWPSDLLETPPHQKNRAYLLTKRDKMGHLLTLEPAAPSRTKGRNRR